MPVEPAPSDRPKCAHRLLANYNPSNSLPAGGKLISLAIIECKLSANISIQCTIYRQPVFTAGNGLVHISPSLNRQNPAAEESSAWHTRFIDSTASIWWIGINEAQRILFHFIHVSLHTSSSSSIYSNLYYLYGDYCHIESSMDIHQCRPRALDFMNLRYSCCIWSPIFLLQVHSNRTRFSRELFTWLGHYEYKGVFFFFNVHVRIRQVWPGLDVNKRPYGYLCHAWITLLHVPFSTTLLMSLVYIWERYSFFFSFLFFFLHFFFLLLINANFSCSLQCP